MWRVDVKLNAAMLSLLLLFGQSAVLVHFIEHPYFGHKDTCVLCQFGQQDKSAVPVSTFFLPPCKQQFVVAEVAPQRLRPVTDRHFEARAPPFYS